MLNYFDEKFCIFDFFFMKLVQMNQAAPPRDIKNGWYETYSTHQEQFRFHGLPSYKQPICRHCRHLVTENNNYYNFVALMYFSNVIKFFFLILQYD